MAIDQTPATTAKSLLNGIDYAGLIGGPLNAAINAQVMAAKSTWEFIKEVGLNEDKDTGEKTAVTVEFAYFKDGEMMKLIVPILAIVPIPCIEVSEIDINFKAKINASSSSSSEQSSSTAVNAKLSGGGKAGWGPFSLSVKFSAGFSAKKDSKSTQESQYSVEYTQDVAVKAVQAGMPDGLQTILNILSSSVTGASPHGEIMYSPVDGSLDLNNVGKANKRDFELNLRDESNLKVPNADVTLKCEQHDLSETGPNSVKLLTAGDSDLPVHLGVGLLADNKDWGWTGPTDSNGKLRFSVWIIKDKAHTITNDTVFQVTASTTIHEKEQTITIPVSVVGQLPAPAIKIDPSSVTLDNTGENPSVNPQSVTLTLTGTDVSGKEPQLTIQNDLKNGLKATCDPTKTGDDGTTTIKLNITDKTQLPTDNSNYPDGITVKVDDLDLTANIAINCKKTNP